MILPKYNMHYTKAPESQILYDLKFGCKVKVCVFQICYSGFYICLKPVTMLLHVMM